MKVVIVGAGEVGFHIASRLSQEGKDVFVIDPKAESIQRVQDAMDAQTIMGSGSDPDVLSEAKISDADIFLAVTDSDEANIVASFMANMLSPNIKKMARLRNAHLEKYYDKLKQESPYIDAVINPEIESVNSILALMEVPDAIEIKSFANAKLKFAGVRIENSSQLLGIKFSNFPNIFKELKPPLVCAIARNDNLIVPNGDDYLMNKDVAYFVSNVDEFNKDFKFFIKDAKQTKKVAIIGGGRTGERLACALSKRKIYTKIIEKNLKRCQKLAKNTNDIIILHGNGSDKSLLTQENIKDCDFIVTLTEKDESNILISLLGKELGVRNTITKINNFSYFKLLPAIGISQIVSSKFSAVDSVLQYVRAKNILSAVTISKEQAEVFEIKINEDYEICGKTLSNVSLPRGAIVIAMIKKEKAIVPTGTTVFEAEDIAVILVLKDAIFKLEKLLNVEKKLFFKNK